jgi:ferritin-like protein
MSIDNIDQLKAHLQTAVEIEWSVIPPYLCALWSIQEGHNELASAALEDVVMEEMLHLTLAANVLNGLNGSPQLAPPKATPPAYPTYLPHSDDAFQVSLLPFSVESLETFRRIESPADGGPPQPDRYRTIAQFYEALLEAVDRLCKSPSVWTGKADRQIGGDLYYYGGGGETIPVSDHDSAIKALKIIMYEGEGLPPTIWDGDNVLLGEGKELAHYFRFDELLRERRYVEGDTPKIGPTGEPILVDYDAVLPMRPNPKAGDSKPGSDLREMADHCNATYTTLLLQLQLALNGRRDLLVDAVQTMKSLQWEAMALMNVPVGDGQTAGPPFEWNPAASPLQPSSSRSAWAR